MKVRYFLQNSKHLTIFAAAIFSLCITAVVGVYLKNSISIEISSDQASVLQVFYGNSNAYSEQESASRSFSSGSNAVEIPLRAHYKNIRIDPGSLPGEILISAIHIKTLFLSETYQGERLFTHIKPLMMISDFKKTRCGVLLTSSGNDPAFEFLTDPPTTSVFIQLIIFAVSLFSFLWAIFYWGCKIIHREKGPLVLMAAFIVVPLALSILLAILFYPGFMSYDTLHALRGARNGVTDSMWPPMVSYVWRIIDYVSPNPSAMHFAQIFLLILSIFYLSIFFTKDAYRSSLFLMFYLTIPVVLGTVAVIWKDVLMASFFLAAYCLILIAEKTQLALKFATLIILAVVLIYLGISVRHNALAGAIPIIFYLSFVLLRDKKKYRFIYSIVLSVILAVPLYSAKSFLDNYSLPSFNPMPSAAGKFIQGTQFLDVAGASICANKNLFGEIAPNIGIEEIRSYYDPRHVNLSAKLFPLIGLDDRIGAAWIKAFIGHPICIWSYKYEMTKFMLGINSGEQFLVTAPAINENEFGYSLKESYIRQLVVDYILAASSLFFFRPWFIFLLSSICFIWRYKRSGLDIRSGLLYFSGISYLASLVIFGNAADARLPFYATTVFAITIFISVWRSKSEIL